MSKSHRSTAILAAAALLLLGLAAAEAALAQAPSLDDLQATRKHPLFSPTRRPPPEPDAPVEVAPPPQVVVDPGPPPAPPPPDVTLTGVIIGPDLKKAILTRNGQEKTINVAEGGEIDGWTVSEIGPREITLERDGESTTLELKVGAPAE